MKIAKKTLSVVLAMTMVFSCFALGLTAAASGSSLQAAIDSTPAGDTLVWDGSQIVESVVISKDITIDFAGAEMNAEEGEPAILITAGNVTLKNAKIKSHFGSYSGQAVLDDLGDFMNQLIANSEPAVDVTGGNVVLEDVVCIGADIRIPTTQTYFVPVGSGLELKNGATLIADSSVFIGRYGINNNVTGANLGGNITFIDGFAAGYLESVKNRAGVTVPETSVKYDAGALAAEFLDNMNTNIDQDEADILSEILNEKRAFVVAQEANLVVETYCKDGSLTVTVNADDSNVIENGFVSYKWIPEDVTINGVTVEVDEVEGVYTAIFAGFDSGVYDVEVTKRMCIDLADYYEFLIDIPQYVRDLSNRLPSKVVELVEKIEPLYEDGIDWFYNVFNKVASIDRNLYRGESGMAPGYDRAMQALVAIGGQDMVYDYFGYYLLDSQGVVVDVPENGLFNRVSALLNGLKASYDTTENIAIYVVENYEEVLSIVNELMVEIDAVYEVFTTEPWAPALESDLLIGAFPNLPEYLGMLNQAGSLLNTANETLAGLERFIGRNADKSLGRWLNAEGVSLGYSKLMNLEDYYNPSFIDGTWLEFNSATQIEPGIYIENFIFDNVTISASTVGAGNVSMVGGFSNVSSGSSERESGQLVTLVASANSGSTFAYWTDAVTNRIVSETASFTFRAGADASYVANFVLDAVKKVTYLSTSKCVVATDEFVGENPSTEEPEAPYVTGYEFIEWVEVSDSGSHIVYKANYVRSSVNYNVMIENDGVGFSGAGEYNLYDVATVSAPSGGFGYWAIFKDGMPVSVASYYSTYSFVVTGDIELQAVYTMSFAKGVAINITKTNADTNKNLITFYSERSAKGYNEVIEVGMILTNSAEIANGYEFDIFNNSVIIAKSANRSTAGTFIVNKKGVNVGDTWYARAYVIVDPGNGRPPEVYYSEIASEMM